MVVGITITPTFKHAAKRFEEECVKRIGIRPIDDDDLVLKKCVMFGKYINSFKSLDKNIPWHHNLIENLVKCKVDSLSSQIKKEYGSHEKYINRGAGKPKGSPANPQ